MGYIGAHGKWPHFSSEDELEQVIYGFNRTTKAYDKSSTIHKLFEKQVEKSADKVAVIHLNNKISYRELNARSNQLAMKLRSSGVNKNDIVALITNRSIDMFIGVMGILKAGGSYLPIDSSYPAGRIQAMLEDSGASIVLTGDQLCRQRDFDRQIITFDENPLYFVDCPNIENINVSSDLAYVIYTSGSTGKPKGVMVEHQAVLNFIVGMTERIDFSPDKSIVCLTTISFDIFVLESILPLVLGMKIIVADPMQLSTYLSNQTVDMLQTTPSTMQLILHDEHNHRYIQGLSEILLGGEAFPPRLFQTLRKYTTAKIYNMYGPTETTVWSALKEVSSSAEITLGGPIANTQMYIVDDDNQPLSIGSVGELCIAGDGLARGYLHRAALTDERFIENPVTKGEKMYKTGDMVRWLHSGEIEFLGRKDDQVKIRGFRVELGEIEHCLEKLEGVKECVVAVKEDDAGQQYLVAYYIASKKLVISDIIAFLRKSLPEFMIPGFYLPLEKIPLTLNAKRDRNALPKPDKQRPPLATEYIAPETHAEVQMTYIWKKMLNRELIGIHDNFFDLGGNSILVSHLHIELERYYPGKVTITDIFSHPSISTLSKHIEQKSTELDTGHDIQILSFPGERTSGRSAYADEMYIKAYIHRHVRDKLEQLSQENDISVNSLLFSAYMSILSEITERDKIQVFLAIEGTKSYKCLCLHFANTEDLIEMCKLLDHQLSNVVQGEIYAGYRLNNILADRHSWIPTVYVDLRRISAIERGKEMALEIKKLHSDFEVSLSHASGDGRERRCETVLHSYIGLLEAIVECG